MSGWMIKLGHKVIQNPMLLAELAPIALPVAAAYGAYKLYEKIKED